MQVFNAQRNKWLFCLGVSVCALAFMALPDALAGLRYDRAALLSGQWWRVITGHLVHLNAAHLAFNLLGLFLLCELLWRDLPWAHGCGLLFFSALGTSALLWRLHPDLAWYAGLSGALHGLWAGCALSGWWSVQQNSGGAAPAASASLKNRALQMFSASSHYFFMWAFMLLALKLGLEAAYGSSAHTERMIEGVVISISHLYGALAGIVYVFLWRSIRGLRSRQYPDTAI